MLESVDVVIVGGGVVGAAIAHALGRYRLDVALLEGDADLSWGTSRANSGIVHSGYHNTPGTAKARLCVRGNQLMPGLAAALHVLFRVNGSLTVAYTREEASALQ